ncbi:MAG: hypothetical protein WC451_03440 [Patescibacteria group bacterium]
MGKIIKQLIIIALILVPGFALADESGLPNMLNGQTTVTTAEGDIYFAGLGANQQMINWQPDYIVGFLWANNNNTILRRCAAASDVTTIVPCMILSSPTNSIDLMRSYTYRDGSVDLETTTLITPANTVNGDVYGVSNVLPSLRQFGKHLYSSGGNNSSSSAYYKMGSYQFNPKAQSYWKADDANKNSAMTETINRLLADSKTLPAATMSGTFDGVCGTAIGTASCPIEQSQYPNGRVWKSDSAVQIGTAPNWVLNYSKVSTWIIGNGTNQTDLTIDASVFDNAALTAAKSSIGLIVRKGNVIVKNTSKISKKINASIFVPNGSLIVEGSNISFTGSYVAEDFILNNSVYNTNFKEDTRDESVWPPGFREFRSMSSSAN